MLNQVVIVGRQKGEIINEENKSYIEIAVQRSVENSEGIYETDVIKCILWNSIATGVTSYCKNNDVLGIKGRIQVENGIQLIVAEKVTFLSSDLKNE